MSFEAIVDTRRTSNDHNKKNSFLNIGKRDMVLGNKWLFLLGKGPKFCPERWAENPLTKDSNKGLIFSLIHFI